MTTEKLFELLTLVDSVTSKQREAVVEIVNLIAINKAVVVKKMWADHFKKTNLVQNPLELDKLEMWDTLPGQNIDLYFFNALSENELNQNNQLRCRAKIYNGNSFSGYKQLRFEAEIDLPPEFINTLSQLIEWKFERHLDLEYQKHIEDQKRIWIENRKDQILK